ncbi:MAG: phosphoribosylamine--glycine ligase [Chloroflexota bacterium]|nr:phosphoribosylamine--glycine ligase [Chloroflexota bacterium]
MRVLVIGGGGREHALAWRLGSSPRVSQLYVAPGNAGTALVAQNLDIAADDVPGLARAAAELKVDLVVVGPEVPLAAGIVDVLQGRGVPAFGPVARAAEIESSKAFAKELMQRYGIPCARSQSFTSLDEAMAYVNDHPLPIVVKADGLAAGKGSVVAQTREEARQALRQMMAERVFGDAGDCVVVEEYLEGVEVSLLAFTDGQAVVPMVPACDYKRALDGDRGPNTGGMGSYSPPRFFGDALTAEVTDHIVRPTVAAMAAEGRPYRGVLYAGLMLTAEGPRAMEFNARFGDPETQVMLPRLESDLVEVMLAVLDGGLSRVPVEWSPRPCVGVVMASGGYPGGYRKGLPIEGLDEVDGDVLVFHAGTREAGGGVVTDGGRVLTVVASGETMAQAREKAYANVARIHFEGCHYRRDIALREVEAGDIAPNTGV